MKSEPGTYVLILKGQLKPSLPVGKWGRIPLHPGFYLYVGSARGPGGVRARIKRHCREKKSLHWHIDYLLEELPLIRCWFTHDPGKLEHFWARVMYKVFTPVNGFGCTDCTCPSHLFHSAHQPSSRDFSNWVDNTIHSLALEDQTPWLDI